MFKKKNLDFPQSEIENDFQKQLLNPSHYRLLTSASGTLTGECPNPVVPRGPLPYPHVVLAPFLDLPLPAHSVHTAHHSLSPSIPLCRPHQLPQ